MALRTVNFRDDVLWPLSRLMGLDPRNDLLSDQAYAYVDYLNVAVRRLYDKIDWPEFTRIESRTPVSHYVDFDQASQTPIGKVLKVYYRDPMATPGSGFDFPFRLNNNGIWVGLDHGTTVWVKFIERCPKYTGVPWQSAITYALGDLVYDPAGGNVYKSAQAANTNHVVTDPTWWTLVAFPFVLADAAIQIAYSMALRDEGQTDKGQAEEQKAGMVTAERGEANLAPIYDTLTDQQQPQPRYRAPAQAATPAQ